MQDFYFSVYHGIDNINIKTQKIAVTWFNARVLAQWVARTFEDREVQYLLKKEREKQAKLLKNKYENNINKIYEHEFYRKYENGEIMEETLISDCKTYNIQYLYTKLPQIYTKK